MEQRKNSSPHTLILPFPAQGHVNSMLKLAELLCLAGVEVTFLVTVATHDRLLRHTDVQSRFGSCSGFRFKTLPESIYEGTKHTADDLLKLYASVSQIAKPFVRKLLSTEAGGPLPPTCVITDGIMGFAMDAAEGTGIPVIYFRTISACAFWSYFCIPQLIEAKELPFQGEDMDAPVSNVGGMEHFLRRRDLPSCCRVPDMGLFEIQVLISETLKTTRAQGLILNTFEDLEGPILSQIRTQCPNLYTIGPIHAHLKSRLGTTPASSNSFWEEDRSCIGWLDQQLPESVLYVSFGSITTLTTDQLMEFWHGLIDSGERFLWVIRPDSVLHKDEDCSEIQSTLEEKTRERGYMVGWAPQEAVLAHPAVCSFLTHSGWNSTLESIVAGVPMVCWSFFADQHVNSRFVSEVWKLGLDMKDMCDRGTVEKMVREVMEKRRGELGRSARRMAEMARKSVGEGGTSYSNLNRLIRDIADRNLGSQPE